MIKSSLLFDNLKKTKKKTSHGFYKNKPSNFSQIIALYFKKNTTAPSLISGSQ